MRSVRLRRATVVSLAASLVVVSSTWVVPATAAAPAPAGDPAKSAAARGAPCGTQPEASYVYLALDAHGRGTGVRAELSFASLNDGDPNVAKSAIPVGYIPKTEKHERAQLLPMSLGDSGTDTRNFVALYDSPNQGPFADFEKLV